MRINEKIDEIEKYLEEFKEIIPDKFEDYKSKIIKAACERYVEKIVEATVDLAFLIIRLKKLKLPEDDIDAFQILKNNKIINQDLFEKLKNAKGMRNIIAHQYGKIDDSIIFESISNELSKDVNRFVDEVKKYMVLWVEND